jgi:hypothetical protein
MAISCKPPSKSTDSSKVGKPLTVSPQTKVLTKKTKA